MVASFRFNLIPARLCQSESYAEDFASFSNPVGRASAVHSFDPAPLPEGFGGSQQNLSLLRVYPIYIL